MPADTFLADPTSPGRLAALLEKCDGALSEAALTEARSIGAEATSAVVAALLSAELTSPSADWTPVAAVYLAADLRLAGTVPSLIGCVLQADVGDELWEAALTALGAIGASTVDPLLAAFDAHSDPDTRASVAGALLATGATDERILNAFLQLLDDDTLEGADKLAQYGDRRALPSLVKALDRAELDPVGDCLANEDILNLAGAVEALGGTLTETQRAKEQGVLRRREQLFLEARRLSAHEIESPQVPVRREHRPGRNDPCHCGSGKKYKKCHLEAEERECAAGSPLTPSPRGGE